MKIHLQAAPLAAVGAKAVNGYTAGDAFAAVLAVWPVSVTAAASVSQLDQLAIQMHVHSYPGIGYEIGRQTVRQITARVLCGQIKTDVQ